MNDDLLRLIVRGVGGGGEGGGRGMGVGVSGIQSSVGMLAALFRPLYKSISLLALLLFLRFPS